MGGTGRVARWGRGRAAWRRRGLFASVAGLVAGTLATGRSRTAEAGHGGAFGIEFHLSVNNTIVDDTTTLTANEANKVALRIDNNGANGSGIVGEATGAGVGVRGVSVQ